MQKRNKCNICKKTQRSLKVKRLYNPFAKQVNVSNKSKYFIHFSQSCHQAKFIIRCRSSLHIKRKFIKRYNDYKWGYIKRILGLNLIQQIFLTVKWDRSIDNNYELKINPDLKIMLTSRRFHCIKIVEFTEKGLFYEGFLHCRGPGWKQTTKEARND